METTVNEDNEIVFSGVFNPIVIKTQNGGEYGICERDGDIVITHNGKEIFIPTYACPGHPGNRMNLLTAKEQDFICKECSGTLIMIFVTP